MNEKKPNKRDAKHRLPWPLMSECIEMKNVNEKKPNKRDKCVSCNEETQFDEFEHIDFRYFYIEGVGQLCCECYNRLYSKNKGFE